MSEVNFLASVGSKDSGGGYDAWEVDYSRKMRLGYGADNATPALFQIQFEVRNDRGQVSRMGVKEE